MVDSLFVVPFVQIVGFYRWQVKRFAFMAQKIVVEKLRCHSPLMMLLLPWIREWECLETAICQFNMMWKVECFVTQCFKNTERKRIVMKIEAEEKIKINEDIISIESKMILVFRIAWMTWAILIGSNIQFIFSDIVKSQRMWVREGERMEVEIPISFSMWYCFNFTCLNDRLDRLLLVVSEW